MNKVFSAIAAAVCLAAGVPVASAAPITSETGVMCCPCRHEVITPMSHVSPVMRQTGSRKLCGSK